MNTQTEIETPLKEGKKRCPSGYKRHKTKKNTCVKKSNGNKPVKKTESIEAPLKHNINIGSIVTWTRNGKDFEGEVVKETPKSYKICCKPNKSKNDDKALYLIPKNNVVLKKVSSLLFKSEQQPSLPTEQPPAPTEQPPAPKPPKPPKPPPEPPSPKPRQSTTSPITASP